MQDLVNLDLNLNVRYQGNIMGNVQFKMKDISDFTHNAAQGY